MLYVICSARVRDRGWILKFVISHFRGQVKVKNKPGLITCFSLPHTNNCMETVTIKAIPGNCLESEDQVISLSFEYGIGNWCSIQMEAFSMVIWIVKTCALTLLTGWYTQDREEPSEDLNSCSSDLF